MNLQSYLHNLLSISSPSGYESKIQSLFKDYIEPYADKIYTDNMGNVIAVKNPEAKYKVLITGHCDEIGFIITGITDKGFLKFEKIGGLDKIVLPGSHIIINNEIIGVIGKKAIHLETKAELKEIKDLFIDIGAKDKEDANKRVKIGDYGTFHSTYTLLSDNIISSKSFDNRAGIYVISEVFKRFNNKDIGLYAVSATQEEVGYRGITTAAHFVNADINICIDVTHATDTPDADKNKDGDVDLNKGGVIYASPSTNVKLFEYIKNIGFSNNIPFQIQATGCPYGTDTNQLQITKDGSATCLISIPLRYMHTQVETCSVNDLNNTILLLEKFTNSITTYTNFKPI